MTVQEELQYEHTITTVLNRKQEDSIVQFYLSGGKTVTQTWIAQHFGVSRKTVYNVLRERGALLDKREMTQLLSLNQVLYQNDMTVKDVESLISQPALNNATILKHLEGLDQAKLKDLVYQLIGRRFLMDQMYSEVTTDAA